MSTTKQVTIIGGGIVGLACAYYIRREGHSVRVIDRNTIGDSCATGNAGYVTPSHFIPLAAPGMISKGLKWMFSPESPFYIHPRMDKSLIQWMWKFNQHCNAGHVNRVKTTLYELCNESKKLHFQLAKDIGNSFQLKQKGIYVVTQNTQTLQEELEIVTQAQALGLNASEVSVAQLKQQFPQLDLQVKGGIYFADDAHLQPAELLQALHSHLISVGVEFIESLKVDQLIVNRNKLQSIRCQRLDHGTQINLEVDQLVVAGGSWSPQLIQSLNLKLPIQAGKGYSVTIDKPWDIDTPIILSDAAVAITPFEQQIRFAGTMEFAGLDLAINPRRVAGILKSVKRFIANFEAEKIDQNLAWSGLRPCTPDGLPLVGRVPQLSNVWVAAGHAMLGLTLAPITGKIISQLVAGNPSLSFIGDESVSNRWREHLALERFN